MFYDVCVKVGIAVCIMGRILMIKMGKHFFFNGSCNDYGLFSYLSIDKIEFTSNQYRLKILLTNY